WLWCERLPSGARHVRSVKSLVAVLDLELHGLAFLKRLEAIHLDCGKVDEHIVSTLLFDEAIALGIIEPLHLPSGHSTASCRVTRSCTRPRCSANAPRLRALYTDREPACQGRIRLRGAEREPGIGRAVATVSCRAAERVLHATA